MTFVSTAFFCLLGLTLPAYYLLPGKGRVVLLLGASYVFYCFWNPIYGFLILGSTVIDYSASRVLEQTPSRAVKRTALWISIAGNLGLLSYFKYTNFALDSLHRLLGPLAGALPVHLDIVLPVGISFYTFQTMSYTIDVYRGVQKSERDFLLFTLFVGFFPQLVAGPIERARDLIPQLKTRCGFSWQNMEEGGRLILWGFLKKTVISDRLADAALPAFFQPERFEAGALAFAAAAMLVVIYLDFSAYSEIATGTARLFGIRLTRNFDFPQTAANIAEFWRRWHVTMSTWVRDYVYMPLGGFRPRSLLLHARTTLITMTLVGLWHGPQWTFVLWGFAHGLCLVVYHTLHMTLFRRLKRATFWHHPALDLGAWLLTTVIRTLIGVLFFTPDLQRAGIFLSKLCLHPSGSSYMEPSVAGGFLLLGCFWIVHYIHSRAGWAKTLGEWSPWLRAGAYAALFYAVFFGSVLESQQFIYFQF